MYIYISKTPAAVTGAPPFKVGPLCMVTPLKLESMQAVLHLLGVVCCPVCLHEVA